MAEIYKLNNPNQKTTRLLTHNREVGAARIICENCFGRHKTIGETMNAKIRKFVPHYPITGSRLCPLREKIGDIKRDYSNS
jgi:hypothetical protein